MIEYKGSKEDIDKQLQCAHVWDGSHQKENYSYSVCRKCNCINKFDFDVKKITWIKNVVRKY